MPIGSRPTLLALVSAAVAASATRSGRRQLGALILALRLFVAQFLPRRGRAGLTDLRFSGIALPTPGLLMLFACAHHLFVTRRARQLDLTSAQLFQRRLDRFSSLATAGVGAAVHLASTSATAALDGVAALGGYARATASAAQEFIDDRRDAVAGSLASSLEQRIDGALHRLVDKVKDAIKDPDMPAAVLQGIDDAIDYIVLPPVRSQVLIKTDELFLTPVKARISRKARRRADRNARAKFLSISENNAESYDGDGDAQRIDAAAGYDADAVGRVRRRRRRRDIEHNHVSRRQRRRPEMKASHAGPIRAVEANSDLGPAGRESSSDDDESWHGLLLEAADDLTAHDDSLSAATMVSGRAQRTWKPQRNWSESFKRCRICSRCCTSLRRAGRRYRAQILHTMNPHDKSLWACTRQPAWWALNLLGIVPKAGQVWWLVLFLLRDMSDEYQICEFIASFEAAKFVTMGWLSLCWGAFKYWRCVNAGDGACETVGPQLDAVDALFFLLQISLVWTSFFRLPFSQRRGIGLHDRQLSSHRTEETPVKFNESTGTAAAGRANGQLLTSPARGAHQPRDTQLSRAFGGDGSGVITELGGDNPGTGHSSGMSDPEWAASAAFTGAAEEAAAAATFGSGEVRVSPALNLSWIGSDLLPRGRESAGGPLRRMFLYVSGLFVVTVLLGMVAWLTMDVHWQRLSTLYFVRVAYGLFSFPFIAFKIPLLSSILIPVQRTGYDERGATVLALPAHMMVHSDRAQKAAAQSERQRYWARMHVDDEQGRDQTPAFAAESPFLKAVRPHASNR